MYLKEQDENGELPSTGTWNFFSKCAEGTLDRHPRQGFRIFSASVSKAPSTAVEGRNEKDLARADMQERKNEPW